jgi:hypothetical protein
MSAVHELKKSMWSREHVNTISRHRPNHNYHRAGDGMLTSTPSVMRLHRTIVVGKVSPKSTPF